MWTYILSFTVSLIYEQLNYIFEMYIRKRKQTIYYTNKSKIQEIKSKLVIWNLNFKIILVNWNFKVKNLQNLIPLTQVNLDKEHQGWTKKRVWEGNGKEMKDRWGCKKEQERVEGWG